MGNRLVQRKNQQGAPSSFQKVLESCLKEIPCRYGSSSFVLVKLSLQACCLRLPALLLLIFAMAFTDETCRMENTESEMESDPMFSLHHTPHRPQRSWRQPIALGLVFGVVCAAVVMWACSSHSFSAHSHVDSKKVELDAVWNGGPVPLGSDKINLRHSGKAQAEVVTPGI